MTTTREVINRALKELRVIAPGDEPEAFEANDALDKLNAILHDLAAQGTTYEHTDLALSDDYPLADSLVQASVMWLAMNLTGVFGVGLNEDQYLKAVDGQETIWAAYLTIPDASFDSALYRLPSNRRYWGST